MTTAAPPARITIDPWDPGYNTSASAEALADLDATSATLNLDVETPAASWAPVTPQPVPPPGTLLVADGVRRIDARLWVSDEPPAPGIVASYAAGLVRCTPGAGAELADVAVRRSMFTPSALAADLRTTAGTYTAHPAKDGSVEQLSQALQVKLTELEVELSGAHRTADDDLLVVDGPLRGRTHLPRTVGYIKTHHTAYLTGPAAAVLGALRTGQRTPVFLMGTSWARYAWYFRLPTRSTAPWAGIARCEAGADLPLDELVRLADTVTTALPALAGVDYKDPRAPQNLVPIGGLEKLLRHRLGDPALLYRALRRATT